jgi:hypothetical protein
VRLIVDSREQAPYFFDHPRYAVEVIPGTLKTGDYSLEGFEDQVAVERKGGGLDDLIACLMGDNRDRFERELIRGLELRAFMVVVEAPWHAVVNKDYTSEMKPHAACQSILAFAQRYRVTFHFAGTRAAAEYCTWGFLKQFWDDRMEEAKKTKA